jgi:hypothetical protein
LPHVVLESVGSRKNPVVRDMANEKRPFEARSIDLSDDDIDAVISCWREDRPALSLDCVSQACDSAGKIKAG